MINVGMIGCGKIAQVRHIPECLSNPDAAIAGFYDFNMDRCRELADKFRAKPYTDYEEMLKTPSIDAVCVLTSNDTHAKIAIKALNAGKHVLCEKPMATTLEDCEAMVAAAKKTGKILMIGQNQRFIKTHRKAKELLKEGLIGDIITFRTTFGHSGADGWSIDGNKSWFFNIERAIFGAMGDLGIHKTDLIHFLTGQRITSVLAYIGTLDKKDSTGVNKIQVDDNAICIYTMTGGAVGTMTASWTYYGKEDNSTVLYGSKGIMRIYDDPDHSLVVDLHDGSRISYDLDWIQTNDNQTKSGVMDEFLNCIKEGREPEASGAEVLYSMKPVFAAMESGKTGKIVKIK